MQPNAASISLHDTPASNDQSAAQSAAAPGRVAQREAMIAVDAATQEVLELARRVAESDISVLIVGETGTGKDVLARQIHQSSARAAAPMLAINCAALPDALVESELFGHEKGAFTGATTTKMGLLEMAPGGTVFLDELGDLPLSLQAKLLRVLESRELLRVGGLRPRQIDVRVIAATNRDVEGDVARGAFRSDLYYRLAAITIDLPPLRRRRADVLPLARHFLTSYTKGLARPRLELAPSAVEAIERHDWPGNVRELRNVIERAAVLCAGPVILPEHLGLGGRRERPATVVAEAGASDVDRLQEALAACAGNQTRAARMLGMPLRTFVRRVARYGVTRPRARAAPQFGSRDERGGDAG